ncbi:MAG: hypothetical protein LQ343_006660 [Gyalolechia ehrenbergii]|nr:MAG: hypothetical protein LQ343_006660 [Gyalolechia ehrenbergii]
MDIYAGIKAPQRPPSMILFQLYANGRHKPAPMQIVITVQRAQYVMTHLATQEELVVVTVYSRICYQVCGNGGQRIYALEVGIWISLQGPAKDRTRTVLQQVAIFSPDFTWSLLTAWETNFEVNDYVFVGHTTEMMGHFSVDHG